MIPFSGRSKIPLSKQTINQPINQSFIHCQMKKESDTRFVVDDYESWFGFFLFHSWSVCVMYSTDEFPEQSRSQPEQIRRDFPLISRPYRSCQNHLGTRNQWRIMIFSRICYLMVSVYLSVTNYATIQTF